MHRTERVIVITALVNMVIYIPIFFSLFFCSPVEMARRLYWLLPWHFAGMGLNLVALILTIRDLYLRPFKNPNTKLTWLLVILQTGGIGWLIYVFRHALRPRVIEVPAGSEGFTASGGSQ